MTTPPAAPAYFGERVSRYDGAYDRIDADGYALRSRLYAVLGLVGHGPGEFLDAGMGAGRLCAALAMRGWTVSGVDASAEMVDAARRRIPAAAERLTKAAIEDLPFPAASFDAVTATGVLEYARVPLALGELARVLRPGGLVVVSYPNPHALYGMWKTRLWYPAVRATKRLLRRPDPRMPHGAGELPPEQFVELLLAAGLEPDAQRLTSFLALPAPLDRILPRTAARLGARLERVAPKAGNRLATQVVYRARRSSLSDTAASTNP